MSFFCHGCHPPLSEGTGERRQERAEIANLWVVQDIQNNACPFNLRFVDHPSLEQQVAKHWKVQPVKVVGGQ